MFPRIATLRLRFAPYYRIWTLYTWIKVLFFLYPSDPLLLLREMRYQVTNLQGVPCSRNASPFSVPMRVP